MDKALHTHMRVRILQKVEDTHVPLFLGAFDSSILDELNGGSDPWEWILDE